MQYLGGGHFFQPLHGFSEGIFGSPTNNQQTWGYIEPYLVGGIPTPLKNMSSSVGMMKFPIYGKYKMFQTTNQIY
jgi:hypothetical protein